MSVSHAHGDIGIKKNLLALGKFFFIFFSVQCRLDARVSGGGGSKIARRIEQ